MKITIPYYIYQKLKDHLEWGISIIYNRYSPAGDFDLKLNAWKSEAQQIMSEISEKEDSDK